MMKFEQGLAALVLSMFALPAVAAEYTLAVEPNYPPGQAQEVYKPLLDYLSRSTGHKFVLKTAANYHVYWRDLRSGSKTDFALEEAHFTDYRVERLGFTPLVKLQQTTRYSLVADPSVAERGPAGLIGYRVVSMPAPSLGYLLLGELYRNPIAQPEIMSVASTWRDGVEMAVNQEAEAAMVPNDLATLYPNLVVVSESREFPGRALSAGGTVPGDVRRAVTEAMLKLHQDESLYEVLVELGAGESSFVTATAAEYAGSERLLRGVFGYKAKAAPARAAAVADTDDEETGGIQVTAEN